MKTYEILEKAAVVMMERGHTKGAYERADGRVCLLGACRVAIGRVAVGHQFEATPFKFLAQATGYDNPAIWNDRPETTEAMAIGALQEAARLAKEAEA